MTDIPEKSYKHLTDEDLGILLGGYRVIKFKDDPKELKGVDVPTGLELVYEIQRRLKKSGPNLSWDLAVDRRKPESDEEEVGLPVAMSVDGILDRREMLIKQFDLLISGLTFYKAYPAWWPIMSEARSEFYAAVNHHANLFIHGERDPKDYCFYFPKIPNQVLDKINQERAKEGAATKFFFIGLKTEREELLQ
jgi:hypothetical protein